MLIPEKERTGRVYQNWGKLFPYNSIKVLKEWIKPGIRRKFENNGKQKVNLHAE
jgi:hypothetical protein